MNNLKKLQNRVKTLKNKPQTIQKSKEWFDARQTRITASEASSCLYKTKEVCSVYENTFNVKIKYNENVCLNPYETRENYIIKKCEAFYGKDVFKDNEFTLWGKKYEDVASRLYSKLKNVRIHEFGLINHPRLKWLGASPDGITDDGIMLEIKCPKSRKINGIIPIYYFIQCQIQLFCCNLEQCDYIECEIEECSDENDFIEKTNICTDEQDYGIVLKHNDKYIYPPKELNTITDYINWKNNNKYDDVSFYIITKYNIITINRSDEWFENVREEIKKTWLLINRLQNNKEDFEKYKESINIINNKKYYEKYNNTNCLISDTDINIINENAINIINENDINIINENAINIINENDINIINENECMIE